MAYCLLGIFGVMMPPIYGEGDQSFHRLREEIMKHSGDDSILAWGFSPAGATPNDPIPGNALAMAPRDFFLDCGRPARRNIPYARLNSLAAN